MGPLEQDVRIYVSRFGVIPKSHQPRKWRLIVDLSAHKGFSVNDGIQSELCSLSYTSVDDAVQHIMSYSRGVLLAKLDIESAYQIIPVHLDDCPLLGMIWKGTQEVRQWPTCMMTSRTRAGVKFQRRAIENVWKFCSPPDKHRYNL